MEFARLERPRARFKRRAGRAHIIYEHDDPIPQQAGVAGGRKCVTDVDVTASCRQVGLRRGCPDASERAHHRQSEATCQIVGLIEAARPASRRVERNRYDCIGAFEDVVSPRAHERGERTGERPPAVVLEGVHDRAKRAIVGAHGARPGHLAPRASTSRARCQRYADRAPAGKRIAARVANRRRERQDRGPAVAAHRPLYRVLERAAACGAARRKEHREQCVSEGGESRAERRYFHGATAAR